MSATHSIILADPGPLTYITSWNKKVSTVFYNLGITETLDETILCA